jgi:WD40 repeat protein
MDNYNFRNTMLTSIFYKKNIYIKKSNALNFAAFLTEDVLSTGDDDGNIRIWDLRAPQQAIFDVKE